MHSLVTLTGNFSIDKLKKVVSQVEVLENQPHLEIHAIYADGNPEFRYREIFVSKIGMGDELKYHVMDIGRVRNVPETISIGDGIYSEQDVEKLREHD